MKESFTRKCALIIAVLLVIAGTIKLGLSIKIDQPKIIEQNTEAIR